MKSRRELREVSMIALYQTYICESNNITYKIEEIIKSLIDEDNVFVNELVIKTLENTNDIDILINKYLTNWTIDRLGKPDQAILRIATYELLFTDTPGVVIIDEAVELSKKYSDDKVKNIINAVLDNILKNEVKK